VKVNNGYFQWKNVELYHTEAMQNPSIILYGAHNAKLQDINIPELTDAHDVLVRIAFVGVCGSDVCRCMNGSSWY
jgi:D-arabinose 1-dehydrogenase-like Zn-dependent alcohol dehydrogenase